MLLELDFKKFLESEASDDFDTEKEWAAKIINNQARLEDFPYFHDYEKTVASEAELVKGHCLFIGAGPVPMTPILLAKEHGIKCDAMDYAQEAVDISKHLLKKINIPVRVFYGDATTFHGFGSYGTIFIALEAGHTGELKKAIFDNIKSQINPSTRILIRGSNAAEDKPDGEQFTNVEGYIHNYFQVMAKKPTFSNLSTSYLLHCEMCPTGKPCGKQNIPNSKSAMPTARPVPGQTPADGMHLAVGSPTAAG